MLYRGRVWNAAQTLALLADKDSEIASLRARSEEDLRALLRLRVPQGPMVMAALAGAGLYDEPTVAQFEAAARALRVDRHRSWFDMCEALRAELGLPPPEPVKPKRAKKTAPV